MCFRITLHFQNKPVLTIFTQKVFAYKIISTGTGTASKKHSPIKPYNKSSYYSVFQVVFIATVSAVSVIDGESGDPEVVVSVVIIEEAITVVTVNITTTSRYVQ